MLQPTRPSRQRCASSAPRSTLCWSCHRPRALHGRTRARALQGAAREGVDQAKDEAKTLYESAKDTLSGWLGSKDRAVAETKDSVDRAVEGTQDAISRNANKASAKVRAAQELRPIQSQRLGLLQYAGSVCRCHSEYHERAG